MATKTVTICDDCNDVIGERGGVLFCGEAKVVGGGALRFAVDGAAYCLRCIEKRVKSLGASPPTRVRKAPPPPPDPPSSYDYDDSGKNRGGGASGPLPPPELPRYARVARALVGGR